MIHFWSQKWDSPLAGLILAPLVYRPHSEHAKQLATSWLGLFPLQDDRLHILQHSPQVAPAQDVLPALLLALCFSVPSSV